MAYTLVGVAARPHTNGEDKDNDTALYFRVYQGEHEIAKVGPIFGHFDDQTWNGPFDLNLTAYGRDLTERDADGLVCNVHIDPNGNDRWEFDFHIKYRFAEGPNEHVRRLKHDGCWLGEGNRDNDFGPGHIGLIPDDVAW